MMSKKSQAIKKLTFIIPAFNEEDTINEILARVKKLKLPNNIKKEIIVINDASTDKTKSKLEKTLNVILLHHKKNKGKGAAIRTGLKQASGDYVIIQDADLEYDPQDIPLLLDPVIGQKAEVVYGSRFLGPHKNMLFWHMVGNKTLSLLTNILYNSTLSDMEVGYKLFPTSLLRSLDLKSNSFGFEPEATSKILKKGIRIYEVPISYTGREFEEGKKITWRDAVIAFYLLFKYRFLN